MTLAAPLEGATVVVCCGPGGVGKTTLSASLALALAEAGRRVCVVTVDPARRLADVLGLDGPSDEPVVVPGVAAGRLSALMLDASSTFDRLVARYATSPAQAAAISENRIYRAMTSSLGGTQEYMAMERLYELHVGGDYDVVVVDTPPTRNALSLLDAPRRLTALFEHRLFRALLMPTRTSLKLFSIATRRVLSTISAAAGAELVADAVDFLQAFTGMEEGFTERAHAMGALLADPATRYVVVTAPRADAVAEARFFVDELRGAGRPVAAVLVNKVHADPGGPLASTLVAGDATLEAAVAAVNRLHDGAVAEAALLAELLVEVREATVVALPLLDGASADVDALAVLGERLSTVVVGAAE